jgi:hypothetical protein
MAKSLGVAYKTMHFPGNDTAAALIKLAVLTQVPEIQIRTARRIDSRGPCLIKQEPRDPMLQNKRLLFASLDISHLVRL